MEAAKTNNLEVRKIDLVQGMMEAYSPTHRLPAFVSLSKANGLRVWYMHEGHCESCGYERDCRRFLEKEAEERGIGLGAEERAISPTLLALRVFNVSKEETKSG